MKTFGKLIRTALVAASVAAVSAQAQQVIYIAGSNGDRTSTNTAINNILASYGNVTFAGTSSDITKANFGVFTGTYRGNATKVNVAFIGATGGIKALAGNQTVRFLPNNATGGSNADPTVGSNPNTPHVPTFARSTNYQSTSPYTGNYGGTFYQTLNDDIVGIVGLKIVASPGFPADDITTQQAKLLFQTGVQPLALFTGNSADKNRLVYATGRNTDAGQRYGFLTEAGFAYTQTVVHFKPTIVGQITGVGNYTVGGNVTSQQLWPIETFSGVNSTVLGNSGATTGANLAPLLTANLKAPAYQFWTNATNSATATFPDATAGWYISYLTPGDADTIAIPNGAVELKWNGVPYSVDNVRQGKYTQWLYQHVLTTAGLSGVGRQFADDLITQLTGQDAAAGGGILLDGVDVSRDKDGGAVTPSYF